MAGDTPAPIIIKRKKVSGGGGHHGGAWKVAYADFVTAMMAFFLLMWLLNATTEKQRKGIADYFAPTIALARVSGGGDGALGGDSVFAENALPKVGTGATSLNAASQNRAVGAVKQGDADKDSPGEPNGLVGEKAAEAEGEDTQGDAAFKAVEQALMGNSGESSVADEQLQHIVTRVTDEGLVIELFATEDGPLFEGEARPTQLLRDLAALIVGASVMVENPVAVEAHTAAYPVVLAENPSWDVSGLRASVFRELLENAGFETRRVSRVAAHADREPSQPNRMDVRNNRIEVIFLRTNI